MRDEEEGRGGIRNEVHPGNRGEQFAYKLLRKKKQNDREFWRRSKHRMCITTKLRDQLLKVTLARSFLVPRFLIQNEAHSDIATSVLPLFSGSGPKKSG